MKQKDNQTNKVLDVKNTAIEFAAHLFFSFHTSNHSMLFRRGEARSKKIFSTLPCPPSAACHDLCAKEKK